MARFLFALACLSFLAAPAAAQDVPGQPRAPSLRDLPFDLVPRAPRREDSSPELRRAPQKSPEKAEKADQTPAPTTLESLYEQLGKAKDRREASAIVKQIERRWLRSGSDTADLLMTRANQAMVARDQETALELFDHIILLKPNWAEAYHRRATLFFTMQDFDGALRDIHTTLQKEPRHFAAMTGLGMILQQTDNKKAAMAAFKKAMELNPHLDNLKEIIERLRPEVEGTKI